MPLSTRICHTRLRVRYAETDASGITHHSAFVPWLEAGRVEWLREAGLSYRDLERQGYNLPVVELHLRYVAATRFDDALIVRSALSDLRSRGLRFSYEVVTDEPHPRQVANGMSRHVCLLGGRIAPLPAAIRRLAEGGEKREGA
ncbi:MAG: acyl-CoA thioesterase [Anaerolineae bacterium]